MGHTRWMSSASVFGNTLTKKPLHKQQTIFCLVKSSSLDTIITKSFIMVRNQAQMRGMIEFILTKPLLLSSHELKENDTEKNGEVDVQPIGTYWLSLSFRGLLHWDNIRGGPCRSLSYCACFYSAAENNPEDHSGAQLRVENTALCKTFRCSSGMHQQL